MHFYQINDLKNKKIVFLDENKNKVSSNKISKNFTKIPLGFPRGVIFYPYINNNIYAFAYDSKDRIQYFYTQEYKNEQRINKFYKNKNIVKKIKNVLNTCKTNLEKYNKNDKQWVISLIVMLMWECHIRIGNYKYKKLYDTNGALTITKEHFNINNNKINLRFIGKKGEINECTLNKGNILFNHLKKLNIDINSNKPLLRFRDNNNKIKSLNYSDVYTYLKTNNITPKDIRMINANILYLKELNKNYDNIKSLNTSRDMSIFQNNILKKVSKKMNHTATVLKKDYLYPNFIGDKNKIMILIKDMRKTKNIFTFLEISLKKKIL